MPPPSLGDRLPPGLGDPQDDFDRPPARKRGLRRRGREPVENQPASIELVKPCAGRIAFGPRAGR
jgi:hypothetical protein